MVHDSEPKRYHMKNQFILFLRNGVYYCEDTNTGKQSSLRTRDKVEAGRLLSVKNEAVRQPAMNLQIAQVYLQHGDPALAARTWQNVMQQMLEGKSGSTLTRWAWASGINIHEFTFALLLGAPCQPGMTQPRFGLKR
jgi:hypothetical protein